MEISFKQGRSARQLCTPPTPGGKEFLTAPYSVADSTQIGTCRVELFNLLGTMRRALLVRPCIGSVIVKVLENNRYDPVRLAKVAGNGTNTT